MAWRLTGDKPLSEPMMAKFADANMRNVASMSQKSDKAMHIKPYEQRGQMVSLVLDKSTRSDIKLIKFSMMGFESVFNKHAIGYEIRAQFTNWNLTLMEISFSCIQTSNKVIPINFCSCHYIMQKFVPIRWPEIKLWK